MFGCEKDKAPAGRDSDFGCRLDYAGVGMKGARGRASKTRVCGGLARLFMAEIQEIRFVFAVSTSVGGGRGRPKTSRPGRKWKLPNPHT